MQDEFQPGERVRHRYEHWWGTIVRKVEPPVGGEAVGDRAIYVVEIDGQQTRHDIRHEDLTRS